MLYQHRQSRCAMRRIRALAHIHTHIHSITVVRGTRSPSHGNSPRNNEITMDEHRRNCLYTLNTKMFQDSTWDGWWFHLFKKEKKLFILIYPGFFSLPHNFHWIRAMKSSVDKERKNQHQANRKKVESRRWMAERTFLQYLTWSLTGNLIKLSTEWCRDKYRVYTRTRTSHLTNARHWVYFLCGHNEDSLTAYFLKSIVHLSR